MSNIDPSKYNYLQYPQLSPEQGYYQVITDSYWAAHPEKGLLMYGTSPQCSRSPSIAEVLDRLHPDHKVIFVPFAWVPIDPRDWAQNWGSYDDDKY